MLGRDVRRLSAPGAFLKGCASVFDLFGVLSGDERVSASSRVKTQIGRRAPIGERKAGRISRDHVWIVMKPKPDSERDRTP